MSSRPFLLTVLLFLSLCHGSSPFSVQQQQQQRLLLRHFQKHSLGKHHTRLVVLPWRKRRIAARCSDLSFSSSSANSNSDADALFLERFKRRQQQVEIAIQKEQASRPPNPDLSPDLVIEQVLHGLSDPHRPSQHFGFLALLRASTPSWRDFLYASVGATPLKRNDDCRYRSTVAEQPDGNNDSSNKRVAMALEAAMSRPNNQFRILVGKEDAPYTIDFPTEALDYQDGTAWIECRLRSECNDELLVALGWSLVQINGSWYVDGFDWQDFRDAYRPGIGREEWERICG